MSSSSAAVDLRDSSLPVVGTLVTRCPHIQSPQGFFHVTWVSSPTMTRDHRRVKQSIASTSHPAFASSFVTRCGKPEKFAIVAPAPDSRRSRR